MKLAKIILASSSLVGLVIAMPVLGQAGQLPGAAGVETPITQVSQFVTIIQNVTKWAYTIFFAIAVFFFLMAAFYYLTAAGDPEKVQKAKNTLIYAAVATAVALLSFGFVQIIQGFIKTGQ